MKFWLRLVVIGLVVVLLASPGGSVSRSQASPPRQEDAALQSARQMLQDMTPQEKVGQLFLVTFQGSTFDENSPIYSLLADHYVGGVVLLRANDNFTGGENLDAQVYQLNKQLQETQWQVSQQTRLLPSGTAAEPSEYIPLLIGIDQEGGSYPYDQLMSGVTQLPSPMAVGATWSPEVSQQVGAVMGKELAAMGFNLYLGPSLDVLDSMQLGSGEDMGVRSFGGSAYWVGKMGQAYIDGLHQGSGDRLMVVASHFPGLGGADRSADEEIATVRRPLELLQKIDLAPFFQVTGNMNEPERNADGLLVSHVRYQGFQGTVRSTTRPVSSDAAALEQILQLPPLDEWRQGGGILVSDNLGSQAVRRFYDPTGINFDARTVAREAFVAGNDLLYVDRFVATGDPDTHTTLTRTLDYFAQKYREDAVFAQRVDASVERILTMKYRLYPEFTIENVVPDEAGLVEVGISQSVAFDVARQAVTLISPDAADLANILPRGPEPRDRMIFFTDVQMGRQCSTCEEEPVIAYDALQNEVLRLYGPRAGGQISQNLLSSFAFIDLSRFLNGLTTNGNELAAMIETDLRMADWVVVSMMEPNSTRPESQAFKRLLNERPDLLRNKRVIVFAFGAPYYLDATDISKLTAYYALYSKTDPSVEVAARILFQDLFAAGSGSLPVSVAGVGYDLDIATSPDMNQVIPLVIDSPGVPVEPDLGTLEPTPAPVFRVGDTIPLRTGVIYDRNNNPVPDGTTVRFMFSVISESSGSTVTQTDTETIDGVARAVYRIDRPGLLEIHAASAQNVLSNLLRLDITTGVSAGVTLVAPTPQPTATQTPTPTVTPTLEPTPTVTPTPVPAVVGFQDWFMALAMAVASAVIVSWLGIRAAIARWGLRWALCGLIGGLLFYNYIAFDLPGSEDLVRESGTLGVLAVTAVGVLLGWGVGLIWRQLDQGRRRPGERPVTGPRSQSR